MRPNKIEKTQALVRKYEEGRSLTFEEHKTLATHFHKVWNEHRDKWKKHGEAMLEAQKKSSDIWRKT